MTLADLTAAESAPYVLGGLLCTFLLLVILVATLARRDDEDGPRG